MSRKVIEKQILNLFSVYFNSEIKFKNRVNCFNLSCEEYEQDCPHYTLKYKNNNFHYDSPSDLKNKLAEEIRSLKTDNSELIFDYDEDECAIFNILYYVDWVFTLQTEFIKNDNLFYNNRMRALYQLSFNTENKLNDFARRGYVRYLFYNSGLISEITELFVYNSTIYYKETPLKKLLENLLLELNKTKKEIIVAKDYIELSISLFDFLETGLTEFDIVSELDFNIKNAFFSKYENFINHNNEYEILSNLKRQISSKKNFKDEFLYKMTIFNYTNIFLDDEKSRIFYKEYNEE